MQLIYKRFGVITGFVLLLALLVANALITRSQLAELVRNQSRVDHAQQVLIWTVCDELTLADVGHKLPLRENADDARAVHADEPADRG